MGEEEEEEEEEEAEAEAEACPLPLCLCLCLLSCESFKHLIWQTIDAQIWCGILEPKLVIEVSLAAIPCRMHRISSDLRS